MRISGGVSNGDLGFSRYREDTKRRRHAENPAGLNCPRSARPFAMNAGHKEHPSTTAACMARPQLNGHPLDSLHDPMPLYSG